MPEGPEVLVTSQYLFSKLKNRIIYGFKTLNFRKITGLNLIENNELQIKNIFSKGKILFFELVEMKTDKKIYMISQFALQGFWTFHKEKTARVEIKIKNHKNDKKYKLYYCDGMNLGSIFITDDKKIFQNKIDGLAPDLLKTEYNFDNFKTWVKQLKNKSHKMIVKILMEQNVGEGIVSGIGNYLVAEILYDSGISPYRTFNSLNEQELFKLYTSIKKISKMSYYNNSTGYMTEFPDEYLKQHKQYIDDKKLPNYHPDVKLKKNDKFSFKVYKQEEDPLGHKVKHDRIISSRTTHWVPSVQN